MGDVMSRLVYELRGPRRPLEFNEKTGALGVGDDFLDGLSERITANIEADHRSDLYQEYFQSLAESPEIDKRSTLAKLADLMP